MDYTTTDTGSNAAASGAAAIFGLGCWLFICVFALLQFGFAIWMIIDILKRQYPQGKENDKVIWLLVTLLVPFGPFIYFFVYKKPNDKLMSGNMSSNNSTMTSETNMVEEKPVE